MLVIRRVTRNVSFPFRREDMEVPILTACASLPVQEAQLPDIVVPVTFARVILQGLAMQALLVCLLLTLGTRQVHVQEIALILVIAVM